MSDGEYGRIAPQIGRLEAGEPRAMHVDKVLLDGVEVQEVVALDDKEGWVEHYVREDGNLLHDDGKCHTERLTGVVEVTFRP